MAVHLDSKGGGSDPTRIFRVTAAALADESTVSAEEMRAARGFMSALGYDTVPPVPDAERHAVAHQIRIMRAAEAMGGVFRLHSPHAPGMTFFGGTAIVPGSPDQDVASVCGSNESPWRAFEACIGEAVEHLSQFDRPDNALDLPLPGDLDLTGELISNGHCDANAKRGGESRTDRIWLPATRLRDGATACIPAHFVLRGNVVSEPGPAPNSCGCAAGSTWEKAVFGALMEVIERDAVALWWAGGAPGRPIPAEKLLDNGAVTFLRRIRGGSLGRQTTLIDISGSLEIPCVAAVSFNVDGNGFAAGFACRPAMADACKAALTEMVQMEVGLELLARKRGLGGAASLNLADRGQEQRALWKVSDETAFLARLSTPFCAGSPARDHADYHAMVAWIGEKGFDIYAVDLTRSQYGISVAKVFVPGLQPYPSPMITQRLQRLQRNFPYARPFDLF